MVFGFFLFVVGYALFYWGYHHMPGQKRYSLWYLLGFGSLFKNVNIPPGQPVQWNASTQTSPNTTQPQNPSSTTTPSNLKGGGMSPIGPGLTLGRTDQGVDWGGSGPLYAINAGTIVNVYNSGWPGGTFIVLRLDKPPAGIPSPDIYYAEDIIPLVSIGQHVNAGDLIGRATGGSSGIELGFADPNAIGQALAARQGGYTEGVPTQLGQQFKKWLETLSPVIGGGGGQV